ncbi:glycoside hydrolase family 48 protein [Cohnella mopanensis]|uniref:glycoside hydrolase family 48 protein n=1 Tax=Cohnella mopanensis TaxID=2911966 RepID=UPI001EF81601|nr:glycoside hydrolase family 48 protein [Cohnella mopanensis]
MVQSIYRKGLIWLLAAAMILSAYASLWIAPKEASAATVYETRFMQLYNQIKNPANGYFSPEGIPYHAIETLMSEAPDYGHMTTSEAYSYWLWLEALYGKYTGDWTRLDAAWANMEKYIIPINEGDGVEEQPTMNYYNPSSPATYAAEKPFPDQYPSQLSGQYSPGADPLDAELKATYGNNQTYLMHWLVDVDNWYGFGNTLNPSHTATYVNTFQRGEEESVWEAITHPSQDNKTFGKTNEGFMSLFTKESAVPAAQWKYTNATDADARAIQVIYWAKRFGYNNTAILNKAKKMGDYLRYGFYDKYFQQIGSAKNGTPTAGSGKNSSMNLLAWYTAWGGGIGSNGNWAWRIGASHAHQAYQNPVTAYALGTTAGGLAPSSATGQADWNASLTRQLEFYNWLLSVEGAIGGGATNSWGGSYSAYPSGVSTFYNMAYQEAPVYTDPDSNSWFGFQAWPLERVAEMYYILASSGDITSQNFQMAKNVISKWIDWSTDYVFVNQKPVTDASGYYLNAAGQRVLGGANPVIATTSAPGEFYIPGGQEWTGQPDTWNSFATFTGNPNFHVITKDPSQDVGVLGSYIKALSFFAAGTKAETGNFTTLGNQAKSLADSLLNVAWNFNDGVGIVKAEERADYSRYFEKEIYFPNGWSGTYGMGNTIPGTGSIPSDPAKGGNGVYISYPQLRPKITQDPQWSYLTNLYNTSWNPTTKKWDKGTPTFKYHRFWSQVDIATAYAEYDRLLGSSTPTVPTAPTGVIASPGNAQVILSWTASAGATSYNVKRAAISGGPYTTVATGVTGTSYTNTGLTNGTTYYYVVSAVNTVGESTNSVQVSVVPAIPTVPVAPTGLTATAGNQQVALSWTASSGAASYNVKRATTSGGPYTNVATGVTAATFTNTGLTNGTTYYYVVSAVNSVGESVNSAQASATPQLAIPAAPTGLTATAGNAQATLSWTASSGAASYNVKRATTSGGPYTTVASGVATTSYTNTGLTNGTTYYYVVSAVNASGESLNSTQASATPQLPSTLKVEYKVGDTSATDSQMKPQLRIVNTGTSSVPLNQLKIRYWYTKGSTQSETFTCDWAGVGCANLTATFTSMSSPATGADTYLEIGFTTGAGSIAAGGNSGEIQSRINLANWSNYNEADDYSYNGTQTSYAPSSNITLYQNGTLIWGNEPGGTTQQPPAVPAGLTGTAGNAQAALSWTASSGATGYNVKRATTSGGPYTTVATGIAATSYTNTGLTNGTAYYYVVSAVNAAGESVNSSQASVTPVAPQPPAAPTGLTATAGNAQVALSWTASSGVTGYNVKRATTSGGPYTTVATGVAATSYTNTGLTNGTTYYYVVSAVNAAGESVNSSQASATPTAPQGPAAPTGLTATAGNAQVVLSWTASSGATSYNVKRAATNGGPYTTVATGASTSYTDTALANGTTYYYVVSAVNAAGESANSTQASATPQNVTSSIVAQYKVSNANATDNMINAIINIKNTGTSAVNLSDLKLRYYFTKDSNAALNFYCDYAQVGTSNVSGAFAAISPAKTGADTYLEISFNSAAGSIAAGGQSGDIQIRVAKADWTNFNEIDDYSFDGTITSYTNWNKTTLYQNGTLVWGIEP